MIKTRKELIKAYIDFFKSKKHKEISNSSLIPINDPTVLFTTAGMHPLVPYLLGQKHAAGKRIANCQKCIRTGDIDSVGDDFHLTFFEMLGNWSLGDYWKEEAIEFSFEFLTKKLGLDKKKLTVTCFAGDKDCKKDEESAEIWKKLGITKIKFNGKDENWWGPAGNTGPCGPDTEMFVNNTEIWNDVFMQYNKDEKGNYNLAKQKNVDTGMGVERVLAVLQNKDIFQIDCFLPLIEKIEKLSKKQYGKEKEETRAMRIIADHIKASVMILGEKITPSNKEQGYVLRRLIRRAIRYGKTLNMQNNFTKELAEIVIGIYSDYKHLGENKEFILLEIEKEENKFRQSLASGLALARNIFSKKIPIDKDKFNELMQNPNKAMLIGRIFDLKRQGKNYALKEPELSEKEVDNATITGAETFLLYQSYGFPLEMIDELAMESGFLVSHHDFRLEQTKHQELSRTATQGKFKSGLSDNSEQVTKYHTAAHLLLAALRQVLGKHVEQRGSNITAERLRMDFSQPEKITASQLEKVEKIVNDNIRKGLEVKREELSLNEAKKSGAMGIFENKYQDVVSVYSIGNISKEICAGPHVTNTKLLGKFKIIKEEASSAGVRRIKAILQ